MKERIEKFNLKIFDKNLPKEKEGIRWMKKGLQDTRRYNIAKRLGFSNDSPEGYLVVAFLGIRLLRQDERLECGLIKNADFGKGFIASPTIIDTAQRGINDLENAINYVSEKYRIDFDKRFLIEKAVNWLTAKYFDKTEKAEFNPDRSMLKKWEQRWKPELDRLQIIPAQTQ